MGTTLRTVPQQRRVAAIGGAVPAALVVSASPSPPGEAGFGATLIPTLSAMNPTAAAGPSQRQPATAEENRCASCSATS